MNRQVKSAIIHKHFLASAVRIKKDEQFQQRGARTFIRYERIID